MTAPIAGGQGMSWWRGLAAKQAILTLTIALGFGILGGMVELYLDWRSTRLEIAEHTRSIMEIAQPSAAEAAYLLNEQLAHRVVSGLARSSTVLGAELLDESGFPLASQKSGQAGRQDAWLAAKLFGDLAEHRLALQHDGKPVGQLTMTLSANALAEGFFGRAASVAAGSLARALAISALVVLGFYAMIIRPLTRLSRQVSRLNPAQPGATPLPVASGHARDEIGHLVQALNHLMAAFQQGLDERDRAEQGLTRLTQELEERVAQRTEALDSAKREIEALNRQLSMDNQRMSAELDVSRKLQRMLLPTPDELRDIPGVEVATYMESAKEVGGDYYDILRDRQHLRIGIGDVTGHGLESGVVMLMTQSAVRTLTTGERGDLAHALSVLNRTIHDNVKRMGSDKNLTLALLDYHPVPEGGMLRISGQHESVIVVRGDGRLEIVDTLYLGMPLGLVEDVDAYCAEIDVRLYPDDVVVLYTDGITEAADARHRLYGLERLCQVIVAQRAESVERIKRAVVEDVMRHIGEQHIFDDLTLIVLKQKRVDLGREWPDSGDTHKEPTS